MGPPESGDYKEELQLRTSSNGIWWAYIPIAPRYTLALGRGTKATSRDLDGSDTSERIFVILKANSTASDTSGLSKREEDYLSVCLKTGSLFG